MKIDLADKSGIEREINGALKSTIDAHGPITVELRSSASKRIYRALAARARRDIKNA